VCETCEWEKVVEQIDELLQDDRYSFAIDTLEGIREWCVKNEHVTPKQADAIENIAARPRD